MQKCPTILAQSNAAGETVGGQWKTVLKNAGAPDDEADGLAEYAYN